MLPDFQATVQGQNAYQYQFWHKPDKIIRVSTDLEEWQAATWAGLSRNEYLALPGAYWWLTEDSPSQDSKSDVIAAYRLMKLLEVIEMDRPPLPKKGK